MLANHAAPPQPLGLLRPQEAPGDLARLTKVLSRIFQIEIKRVYSPLELKLKGHGLRPAYARG